jgi:hypothetical protein
MQLFKMEVFQIMLILEKHSQMIEVHAKGDCWVNKSAYSHDSAYAEV